MRWDWEIHPGKIEDLSTDEVVKRIITLNTNLSVFWGEMAEGWADEETSEALSAARLDVMVSFSHRLNDLFRTVPPEEETAHLISSWVTLGSLVESSLALFFTVYRNNYMENPVTSRRKKDFGAPLETHDVSFEDFRCLMSKHELVSQDLIVWIQSIQQYRNAIHFFKDRKIGTREDIEKSLKQYLELLRSLNERMPYPDEIYAPNEIVPFIAR